MHNASSLRRHAHGHETPGRADTPQAPGTTPNASAPTAPGLAARTDANEIPPAATPPGPHLQPASVTEAPRLDAGVKRAAPESGFDCGTAGNVKRVRGSREDTSLRDCDIQARDENGNTLLMRAVIDESEARVRALLALSDVDINARNRMGETALICAAKNGHSAILQRLLAAPGIEHSVTEKMPSGFPSFSGAPSILTNALICAAEHGQEDSVRALLATPGLNVNTKKRCGTDALRGAISGGHEAIVRLLLAMPNLYPVSMPCEDSRSDLPLTRREQRIRQAKLAVRNHRLPTTGESRLIHQLLQKIFLPPPEAKRSAASSSASAGYKEAKKLHEICGKLQCGRCAAAEVAALFGSIDTLSREAQTTAALSLAFGYYAGHFRNAAGLLADAFALPLKKADLYRCFADAVETLKSATASINLYRVEGMSLLGIAAKSGNIGMMRGLMQMGAEPNLPAAADRTALAIAVEHRQWGACAELIHHGALPLLPDHSGFPVLYRIMCDFCSNEHGSVSLALLVRYLILKGVPFDIPVRNPDESARAKVPTVLLSDLMFRNPESWARYGYLLLGLHQLPVSTDTQRPSEQ